MNRNLSLFVYLLLCVTLLLSACGRLPLSGEPTPAPPPTVTATPTRLPPPTPTPTEFVMRGTVRLWHSWDEAELPALVQIRDGFRALYPDVNFDVLYVPADDLLARYQAEALEGRGPGLLFGPAEWGPELYDALLLADLSSVAGDSLLASLNQPALGAARYKGALIGLPYAVQGVVLYRNQDILTISANSFDDLVTLAQTSTIGDDIGAVLERSFFYSGAHLQGIGGRLMDEDGLPAFNDPKGLEWIDLLLAFDLAGPTNYFTDEDLELFKSGRVGWIIDGTWNLDELAEAIGADKLAIDAWPTYQDGRLSGYVRAENLYLNPRINEADLIVTRAFIEYFLSPEAQARLAEVGRIPAVSGAPVADSLNGPLINQAMAALANGMTYPVSPEMVLYNINLDIALRSVFEEQVPPEQALLTAQESILAAIAESQAQITPTP